MKLMMKAPVLAWNHFDSRLRFQKSFRYIFIRIRFDSCCCWYSFIVSTTGWLKRKINNWCLGTNRFLCASPHNKTAKPHNFFWKSSWMNEKLFFFSFFLIFGKRFIRNFATKSPKSYENLISFMENIFKERRKWKIFLKEPNLHLQILWLFVQKRTLLQIHENFKEVGRWRKISKILWWWDNQNVYKSEEYESNEGKTHNL